MRSIDIPFIAIHYSDHIVHNVLLISQVYISSFLLRVGTREEGWSYSKAWGP